MRRRGFTLIELLITLAVLAVLAMLTVPVAELSLRRADELELRRALREMRAAIDAYKAASDEGRIQRSAFASGYPPNLEVLVEGVEDIKDPKRRRLYFLRRVPRNPLVAADADPLAGWGLRSYASEPDQPEEGEDVFDVYVRSEALGLNGIPYRQW